MKKILKQILFGIFLYFLTINFTLAKTYLKYDNSTELGLAANYLYYDETIEDDNYYYTTSINNEYAGVIRKVNKKDLSIEWESPNYWGLYIGLEQDENYLYALFLGNSDGFENKYYVIAISKEDGSFTTDSYIYLETEDSIDGEIYYKDNNLYVITRGYSTDYSNAYETQKLYTIDVQSKTVTSTKDYKDVDKEIINSITDNEDLYDNIWDSIYPDEYDYIFISNEYNAGDAKYFVGEATKDEKITSFIIKTDVEGKFLWIKKAEDNFHYFDINGYNNKFIVVIGYQDNAILGNERNQDTVTSSLIVLNPDGNILETHDVAKEIGLENIDLTHIHTFNDEFVLQAFGKSDELNSYLIRYKYIRHNITKEVIGKGSLNVPSDAAVEEQVNIEAIPEEGYVLKNITIKSASGKVIDMENNSFIMPDEDVNIIATFEEKPFINQVTDNPPTGFISVTMAIVLIIVLVIAYLRVRKNKINNI